LKEAIVIVDDTEQAVHSGEINVPISKGTYSLGEVHGTLAELVTGSKQGRPDDRAITVFDSTGIGIADIAVAKALFEKARQVGGYPSIDFVGV
jgi:alanine dehydrogenase